MNRIRPKYKVGKEPRGYTKGKGKVDEVLGSGAFSGKSMSFRKGPGAPASKRRRKAQWYEGKPMQVSAGTWVSRVFSTKLG